MNTKELILHTAVSLFNQLGTAHVTTNLIAEKAQISPGNLYYHFKDKAHIIREIYEQMIQDWESVYNPVEEDGMPDKALQNFIEENFELLWQYRFFYRETVALLQADPALLERHVSITQSRFERQRRFLQKAASAGLLRFPEPETQLGDVLTIAWIIANHYLVYLESMGHTVEKSDYRQGAALVLQVLRPYLAPPPETNTFS